MNLPLPKTTATQKPAGDGNAGLWYDKFFNGWNERFDSVPDESKYTWVKAAAHLCGNPHVLSEHSDRLRQWVSMLQGHVLAFKTDGRFVTGLGREHPVENGFAWHHTLGTPYLPGSSVKGLLRAWAREQGTDNDIERIFGPQNRKAPAVGSVIFFDALPTRPVQLDADVMTPHYGLYYQDHDANTPPADWHNPVPIPFLAVADAQPFVFAFAPRRPHHPKDTQDCATVANCLGDALTWLGAGAKTAVGYGRFTLDSKATETAAKQQHDTQRQRDHAVELAARLAHLGPLAQELAREIDAKQLATDKNAFGAPPWIEDWLGKLEANPASDAVSRLSDLIEQHFPGLLVNPEKTHGKKHKPRFNDRQRAIAERLNRLRDSC